MYFSQGLSLESYRSNYPLSIENFLHTAILIAEAVHDLHKKNEIIGVLTPANIKLSSHPYSAQITDLMSWNNAYRAPEYDNKLMTTPGQRSDLYSLGIIYYEMLAGVLPYQMPEDPNEWFYTHLIETPTSLILQRDDLPEIIEKMVFKLLNKAPSDRYASAYGLLHDLQKCYDDYCKPDGIQVFQLGLKDNRAISELTNIFIDRDVSNLILAFEQMKKNKGKNMLVSVAGDNGTGKTELVRQFLNLITDEVIVIGTSLEHNRSGDSLIVEAIRNGFAQLWFQDKKKILSMKDKIERECGDHISYIWTLFPVESQRLALYPQKLQADLKNQAQLAKVLAMLIKSFTLLQIPIIIAIDDLHVADELSHHVLEELIFEKSLSHTMIIGITENEEVPYTEHLLRQRKSSIIENERILPIQLQNFSYEEVRIFFQMLVHEDSMPMRLLARIAYDLSKGNPSQLKALVQRWMESNRLRFDEEKAAWNWDEIIEDTSYHLSSERLYLYREAYNRLNEEVKTLLYIASVIGMRFNVNQLCALDRQPSSKLISLLEQAEREGIICREDIRSSSQDDTDYLFLHTSIQQLLYQRFEAEAEEWHYKIGSYYWEAYKKHQRYEDCIDAAKHWNKVLPYLKADEQDALLQLNIINAKHYNWIRKHQEAVSAAEAGIALADRLGRSVEQKFEFYIAAAIGEHMLGNVNKSYAYLQLLMDHYDKLQTQDRIQLLLKQLQIYTFADQQEAYRIGKVGLLENGWVVPEKVSPFRLLKEVFKTQLMLRKYRKKDYLPDINNEQDFLTFNELIIGFLISTASIDPIKMLFLLARYVQYCMKKGLSEIFVIGLGGYELILQRELRTLYQWFPSDMFPKAEQALLKEGIQSYRLLLIKGLYFHLEQPELAFDYWLRVIRRSIENKDIVTANLAMTFQLSSYYGNIHQLRDLHQYLEGEANEYVDEKSKELLDISKSYVLALGDEKFASTYIAELNIEEKHPWYMLSCNYRMEISYMLGEYRQAMMWADQGLKMAGNLDLSHIYRFKLFKSLSAAALYRSASELDRKKTRSLVKELVRSMNGWLGQWGKNTFAHSLIKAEYYRIAGMEQEAIASYQDAIKQAQNNNFQLIEAIANERLFDCMAARGEQELAAMYLMDACTAYAAWGITAKMDWLRKKYPHIQWYYTKLAEENLEHSVNDELQHEKLPLTESDGASAELSVASAHVNEISSLQQETELWELIGSTFNTKTRYGLLAFLEFVIKQLGGTRISLIHVKGNSYTVEYAAGRPIAEEHRQILPTAMIRYVLNTDQPYIIDDAMEKLMLNDDYFKLHHPRSIICVPFGRIKDGNRKLLYMENSNIPSQFTERTLQLLELFITRYLYLNWLNEKEHPEQAGKAVSTSGAEEQAQSLGLIEALTQRELEMLMYIHDGLSNKEIAIVLQISEATVKTHITNLYGKLGVKRRSQAIVRAQELNIFSSKS